MSLSDILERQQCFEFTVSVREQQRQQVLVTSSSGSGRFDATKASQWQVLVTSFSDSGPASDHWASVGLSDILERQLLPQCLMSV